jgi:hypothetical protein
MRINLLGTIVLLCCGLFFSSCGNVPEIPPPSSSTPSSPAVIDSALKGAQTASETAQARELILTSSRLFKDLADLGLAQMTPAIPASPTSAACADGGTYDYSGSYSAPDTYTVTITMNGCRQNGFQFVGTYTLAGTTINFNVTLGNSGNTFNIFNFDTSYTVLYAYLKASLSYTMTSAGTLPNASCTIATTGPITTFDYFLLDTFSMTFSNLTTAVTLSQNANLDLATTIQVNGRFSERWAGGTNYAMVSFAGTTITMNQYNGAVAPAVNYTAADKSVDGRITFSFLPSYGFSGLFDVITSTPIDYSIGPPLQTTQGMLETNGTASTIYNPGGTVDIAVTLATSSTPDTLSFASEYALMKLADFAALEQDRPPLLGTTTVSSITGSTMAVTLTWTGPAPSYASTSDMDLHLKYYSTTTPTVGTSETWHMDWHQGKSYPGSSASCTNPTGISFSDAFDLDGAHDGTCDVGLDFDDTNGYGPEHITALQITSGYYVVSVNSFSLPGGEAPTTMYLSIHFGDLIYGPYVGTISASDGEGTDPNSWYRVADVRVNAGGMIDVLTPDLTLTPWH